MSEPQFSQPHSGTAVWQWWWAKVKALAALVKFQNPGTGGAGPWSGFKVWGEIHFRAHDICFHCMFVTNFSGHNKIWGAMPPWLGAWGVPWWSKFYKRDCQKWWTTCIHIVSFVKASAFSLTIFFIADNENNGQSNRCKWHFCRRFKSCCYYH